MLWEINFYENVDLAILKTVLATTDSRKNSREYSALHEKKTDVYGIRQQTASLQELTINCDSNVKFLYNKNA